MLEALANSVIQDYPKRERGGDSRGLKFCVDQPASF